MRPMPLLALGLLALLPLACEKSKFAEQNASSDTYSVKVVDGDNPGASAQGGSDATASRDDDDDKDEDKSGKSGSGKSSEDDDKSDQAACAAAGGLNADRVHISGSEKDVTLTSDAAYALKVTGSKNVVNLKVAGATPATRLAVLCLFVSGNQNHVVLDIGMTVGQIFVKARGNQALIEGKVSKDGVIENIVVDAKGHEPQIKLEGEGKFPSL